MSRLDFLMPSRLRYRKTHNGKWIKPLTFQAQHQVSIVLNNYVGELLHSRKKQLNPSVISLLHVTIDRPGAQLVFGTTCRLTNLFVSQTFAWCLALENVLDPIIFMSYYSLEGEVFNVERYDNRKTFINISRHMADATTKQSTVSINPENHSAEIVLHLETGKRFQFGPIDIKGQTYDKDYLRSLALYKPGMMYDEALIAEYKIIWNQRIYSPMLPSFSMDVDRIRSFQQRCFTNQRPVCSMG